MDYKDYYQTLGVSKSAPADEIKKTYRKLARKFHPDLNSEKGSEDKLKEINEAYDVLKDKEKRAAYDQLGADWKHAGAGGWSGGRGSQGFSGDDFSDFFDSVFRQQQGGFAGGFGGQQQSRAAQKGKDQELALEITLEEAFLGGEKIIQLPIKNPINQYGTPEFKKLKIAIPKGTVSGRKIRLSGQGHTSPQGGKSGDLILELNIRKHALYEVNGQDITLKMPITPWEAALGTKINTPTLAGSVGLSIPKNAKSGQKLRLKGRGIATKSGTGDQYVELLIQNPELEAEEADSYFSQMKKKYDFNPRKF